MSTWETYPFPKTIVKTKIGRANQINSSEINSSGRFPVVDQGQAYIAGYSDDESKVIKNGLPVIIFGDHTRCFKYVDFPFILGGDGTKVLKPNGELFHPKFFYFSLLSLDIPSRGYNRHFTLLKEQKIPHPEFDEQKKISIVLSTGQRAIEQQERLIELTTELKKALMYKLFTEGLRGVPQKQTEIGPVPESWQVVPLEEVLIHKIVDGVHKTPNYIESGIPFITAKDIIDGEICFDECRYISAKAHEQLTRRVKPEKGDVLITKVGTVGNTAIIDFEQEFSIFVQIALLKPSYNMIVPEYLYWMLQSDAVQYEIMANAPQSTMKFIGVQKLAKVKIPCPSIQEQKEISEVLDAVKLKKKNSKAKRDKLTDLFRTLLHQLMTAQTRVHDLGELEDLTSKGV